MLRHTPRILICLLAGSLSLGTAVAAGDEVRRGDVVVIPLQGEVSPSLALFIRRAEKTAESGGASAIILDMNTYGGQLDAAEEITSILNHATIPTYTYVNSNAGSAGSLIALSTKHIYMAPVSAIGAAAPILSTGQDLPPTEKEKTISYWSALVRSTALRNGHDPDIGEAFMDKDKEVKIGNRVIHPKGSLLTLSAQEATEKVNGKPLLADGIAESITDLTRKAGLKGEVVQFEPSGFEQLAFWLTQLSPLLLLGGILGAYLEFKIPGVRHCRNHLDYLFCALFSRALFRRAWPAGKPSRSSSSVFVFVLVEILFFGHSTIVFGVVGVLLMFASLLWAMIDRYPGQNFLPTRTNAENSLAQSRR